MTAEKQRSAPNIENSINNVKTFSKNVRGTKLSTAVKICSNPGDYYEATKQQL